MTELIWDGKYDKATGKKVAPLRVALPFQTVETVNESVQERQRSLDFFAEGRDSEWRNRLIWGDKKYVLPSLLSGTSPMVEIFTDRMEISNPGRPLITPLRFVDEPPRSRNEDLASFMRRVHICEERGSGIDKVLRAVELYQLPAPEIVETSEATRVTLFAKRDFREMSSQERMSACYWHACLLHVSGTQMTNETLRKRLGLEDSKHNQVGRIISDARKANRIKPYDPDNRSPRYARYVPFWA